MAGLPDRPMPIRSGARQRAVPVSSGMTVRHRNDDVGLPCSKTIGSPSPWSSQCIVESSTRTLATALLLFRTPRRIVVIPTRNGAATDGQPPGPLLLGDPLRSAVPWQRAVWPRPGRQRRRHGPGFEDKRRLAQPISMIVPTSTPPPCWRPGHPLAKLTAASRSSSLIIVYAPSVVSAPQLPGGRALALR